MEGTGIKTHAISNVCFTYKQQVAVNNQWYSYRQFNKWELQLPRNNARPTKFYSKVCKGVGRIHRRKQIKDD